MSAPRSVFFQQHIQHGVQIGGFYAGVFRFGHGAGEVSSTWRSRPRRSSRLPPATKEPLPLHGVDEAGFFQFRVGPLGGDDADAQIVRQGADGGKGSPSFTSPAMMAALI